MLNVISFSFTPKSLLTMGEEFVYENNKRQVFFFFELRGCNGLARPHGSKLQPKVTNTFIATWLWELITPLGCHQQTHRYLMEHA